MTRRLFLGAALGLALCTMAHAGWVPTGYTKFDPPATVQGAPAVTVPLRGRLFYELRTDTRPVKKKWEALVGATVNFYVKGKGIIGEDACQQGKTNSKGVSTSSWTIPNPPKAKRYTYRVEYTGGRKDGIVLKRTHDTGRIDVP